MRRCGNPRGRVLLLGRAIVLVLAIPRGAQAQTDVTTARITGYVRDAVGRPLRDASVTGSNEATGHAVAATSGMDGFYQLVDLPTGTYTLTASLAGLGDRTRPGIRLVLGSSSSVDFVLEMSNVSESVTVGSEVPPSR